MGMLESTADALIVQQQFDLAGGQLPPAERCQIPREWELVQ